MRYYASSYMAKAGLIMLLLYTFVLYSMVTFWLRAWPLNDSARAFVLPWIPAETTKTFTDYELERLGKILWNSSSNSDNTVVLTAVNKAWTTSPMLDYFLDSFRIGENTSHLLENLVIVALDKAAYKKCTTVHGRCFVLKTDGLDFSAEKAFNSEDHRSMMRKKISFLSIVLQMGYNFVYTDADVMWLRNPFPAFSEKADMEIACDFFNGNDMDLRSNSSVGFMQVRTNNEINAGFMRVKTNPRTISLFKYWDRHSKFYYDVHEQDAFKRIKNHREFKNINAQIRLLSTEVFSGFCQPAVDFNRVCTMHANCCKGLDAKISDLQLVKEDWSQYMSHRRSTKFRSPKACLNGCFKFFTSKKCLESIGAI